MLCLRYLLPFTCISIQLIYFTDICDALAFFAAAKLISYMAEKPLKSKFVHAQEGKKGKKKQKRNVKIKCATYLLINFHM